MLSFIRDKLSDEGVPVPFSSSVTSPSTARAACCGESRPPGRAGGPGSRADAADRLDISIAPAGPKWTSIDVEAKSLIPAGADALIDSSSRSKTPLIVRSAPHFITNKGVIYLDDVHFRYLGQGEISVRDVTAAIKRALGLLAVLGPRGPPSARRRRRSWNSRNSPAW